MSSPLLEERWLQLLVTRFHLENWAKILILFGLGFAEKWGNFVNFCSFYLFVNIPEHVKYLSCNPKTKKCGVVPYQKFSYHFCGHSHMLMMVLAFELQYDKTFLHSVHILDSKHQSAEFGKLFWYVTAMFATHEPERPNNSIDYFSVGNQVCWWCRFFTLEVCHY